MALKKLDEKVKKIPSLEPVKKTVTLMWNVARQLKRMGRDQLFDVASKAHDFMKKNIPAEKRDIYQATGAAVMVASALYVGYLAHEGTPEWQEKMEDAGRSLASYIPSETGLVPYFNPANLAGDFSYDAVANQVALFSKQAGNTIAHLLHTAVGPRIMKDVMLTAGRAGPAGMLPLPVTQLPGWVGNRALAIAHPVSEKYTGDILSFGARVGLNAYKQLVSGPEIASEKEFQAFVSETGFLINATSKVLHQLGAKSAFWFLVSKSWDYWGETIAFLVFNAFPLGLAFNALPG